MLCCFELPEILCSACGSGRQAHQGRFTFINPWCRNRHPLGPSNRCPRRNLQSTICNLQLPFTMIASRPCAELSSSLISGLFLAKTSLREQGELEGLPLQNSLHARRKVERTFLKPYPSVFDNPCRWRYIVNYINQHTHELGSTPG